MQANEAKKNRGWTMRILERTYPEGMDQETIKKQLIELQLTPSAADMRGVVAYLQDKRYIKVTRVGSGVLEREVIALTARGVDLLEGNIDRDSGVDLGD